MSIFSALKIDLSPKGRGETSSIEKLYSLSIDFYPSLLYVKKC